MIKLPLKTWIFGAAALSVLTIFLVLSCGARKATPPEAASYADVATLIHPQNGSTPYVDTSIHAMKVWYKGWSGDTAKALNNLRQQIASILDGREMNRADVSAKVVLFEPNDSLHDIFSLDPSTSVLPASTEKMFTSSSTLWALGSKYAFTTKLDLAPASKISGSNIVGNVYLRPSGDPTLTTNDLDNLASQLRAKGITSIQGDIVSDLDGENPLTPEAQQSLAESNASQISVHDSVVGDNGMITSTDTDTSAALNDEEDDEEDVAGSMSAFPNFSLNRNIVAVTVFGGSSKGSAAGVRIYPPIASVAVSNSAKSSAPAVYHSRRIGRGRHRRTVRSMSRGVMTLRVSSSGGPMDPKQTIYVSGMIPARSQRTYSFPIKNVPMAMAAVMKWRLQQDGISVTGQPRVDRAKPNEVLQTVAQKETSLLDLLTYMNKHSDNYLAESMFRKLSTIAQVAANAPDERARKLMRSWLRVCNVDATVCTFIDGSGLSKEDRVSANTVINLLAAIKRQGMFPLFTHTLSVAGYDGTLRHRMIGTAAQYNAHGKTGTLNGVTALAGYVTTGDGQLAAYFITMQNFRGGQWTYKRDEDKVIEALANFKYSDYQSSATIPSVGSMGSDAEER